MACAQRLGKASKAIETDGSRLFAVFPLVGMRSFDVLRETAKAVGQPAPSMSSDAGQLADISS